tara:strand:+ start:3882 stop:4235 length:354 start_codon:yes stop_codon:yes gene_type:complete
MAVVALNKFRTIRVAITTTNTGIYTCPSGVASIIILSQVTNISTGTSSFNVTASHSRSTETQSDYLFANAVPIPPNDSVSLIPTGRLALETNDVFKIKASSNGVLNLVLSILETAKQ